MIKNYNTKYGKCNITYLEYQKVVEKLNHLLSIHFNLLPPHSLFDACPSARKTFVYARISEFEDNSFDAKKRILYECVYDTFSVEYILLRMFTHPQQFMQQAYTIGNGFRYKQYCVCICIGCIKYFEYISMLRVCAIF